MTAKTSNIAPPNALLIRELGRFWPSWLNSFANIILRDAWDGTIEFEFIGVLPGIHGGCG